MKKCFKCGELKPLNDFYKHKKMPDGHVNKCKECNKKDVRENYRKNIDYYKNFDQIRNQKRKNYIREKNKIYQKNNPEIVAAAKKKWADKNKLKKAACTILGKAVRSKKVKKGLCQICKSKEVEAHHYDYTKPLDVIWLCKEHHEKIHWWLRWNKRNSTSSNLSNSE